jgi:hypothetical protein
MNHIDNTISDTIDQIQRSDQQAVQAAPDDITAIFARLNPQDVEHFYQSYRFWSIQPRIQTLHREIAELQQAIVLNAQLIDQYRPSPIAQSILDQFQTNGVDDLDLLDRMLERGDDWLEHIMQLLEQCERLDIIHGNYTEWCEHALEGAYDWIGSMSEDDTAGEDREATPSTPAEVFDESTEQLLLQKLLSEDDSAQTPDLVEQLANDTVPNDTVPEEDTVDVPIELPANDIASEEHIVDASTELAANVEIASDEIALLATPQPAQDEHTEKQTADEEPGALATNGTDTPSAEEHSLLQVTETERSDDEESATDLVTIQSDASETIEVLDAEKEVSVEFQQETSTAEIITSAAEDEALDTTTAEVADLVDTANEVLDTTTFEVADLVDAASDTLDTTPAEVADLNTSIEMVAIEPGPTEVEEETTDPTSVPFQDRAPLQEEHSVEEIESAPLELTLEPSDTISAPELLDEAAIKDGQEDMVAEVSSSPASAPAEEEQLSTAAPGDAGEIEELPSQSVIGVTDVEAVMPSVIEQPETLQDDAIIEAMATPAPEPETAQDDAIIEATATSAPESEATQDEVLTETKATPAPEDVTPVEKSIPEDDDEEEAIEEQEGEIATIANEAATQPDEHHGYDRDDSSGSNDDTIAIPKISFLTSRATPPRVLAIAKADTQQEIPVQAVVQPPSPKEEGTFIEAATIPNLPTITTQISQSQIPSKEQVETTTIVPRQAEPDTAYTQPPTRHYPTPIWQEYSTNSGNGYQNQALAQSTPETLPEPRPGFFRRLWRWFVAWLNG